MWNLIRPLLFKMDAEQAHRWSLETLEEYPFFVLKPHEDYQSSPNTRSGC